MSVIQIGTRFGAEAFSRLRSLGYSAEFIALRGLSDLVPRPGHERTRLQEIDWKLIESIRADLERFLSEDAERIAQGVYPISVLKPESPWRHLLRIPRIVWDGVQADRRRREGRTTVFSPEASERLEELPRYYRRNFHFQTDGYLSEHSAELYDHQVEILFRGSADAMRRLLIEPMKRRLATTDGKGLHFLEVACGTGSATRLMRLAFPKARFTATDLSDPYLKVARRRTMNDERVQFLQAAAEKLPFKDNEFDASYSVFLFHELPLEARKAVLTEQLRVTRPGGALGAIDSVQPGDAPDFIQPLEQFPRDYHEPFYRNYLENPLEELFSAAGAHAIEHGRGFFSKWVLGQKS